MIPGITLSQGKKPTTPTISTATAGDATATVTFTESTYKGKANGGTYQATSSPQSIIGTCTAPCSSIAVSPLVNGTAYTFTVKLQTPDGVNSDSSAASNSVSPVAPPFFPPFFPSFGPFFPPFFPSFAPVCGGCAPGLYGYYGGTYPSCASTSGWGYSCVGYPGPLTGESYMYYQSACCPDVAICPAYRSGVCGYP